MADTRAQLDITVGVAPSGQPSLSEELRLIKVGLLYGDTVRLCSPTACLLMSLGGVAELSGHDLQKVVLQALEQIADPPTKANILELRQLQVKKRKTREEILRQMKAEALMRQASSEIVEKIESFVSSAGGEGLVEALGSGVVTLDYIDTSDSADVASIYFLKMLESVASGQTYPLLDGQTAGLIKSAVREGMIGETRGGGRLSQISGIAADVLSRLPLLEEASASELIQIRLDLDRPLRRFRGAVAAWSSELTSTQWDPEFGSEAEVLFRERVDPLIAELEEEIAANTLATRIRRRVSAPYREGALAVVIGKLADIADLGAMSIGAIAAAGAAGSVLVSSVDDWKKHNREMERSQVFFYVAAKGRLASSQPKHREAK